MPQSRKPHAMGAGALLALVVALAPPWTASAGDARTGTMIMIAFRSQREICEEIASAVVSQLVDLPLRLIVEWVDAPAPTAGEQISEAGRFAKRPATVAVFWHESTEGGAGLLYLADAEQSRILVRRLPPEDEGGRFEALALMVQSAVDVMLRGGEIGVVEPALAGAASGPAPAAAPPKPDRSGGRLVGLEVAYAIQFRSRAIPFTHGVELDLALRPVSGLTVSIGYGLWFPSRADGENAQIEVSRHPVRAGIGYLFAVGPVFLGGGLSAILDFTKQETLRILSDAPGAVGLDNSDPFFALLPEIRLEAHPTEYVFVTVGIGAQIVFDNVEYRYSSRSGIEVIERPWPVQPRVAVGLGFWFP